MAWPKGQPRGPRKQNPPGNEPIPDDEPVVIHEQEIAPFDTCRYHRTEEPKIFKAGEIIPEGWEDTPDKFKE